MKKYVAAVILVLCLVLGACDGRGKESGGQADRLGPAAELTDDTVLLTVDGREIPAWRYLYWLAYTCQRVQERYQASGLPLDWETPVSGGTLADYVKDQALADTALYATVENWAEQYGCTVPDTQGETSHLPDMGLTGEQMGELERVGQMYAQLYDLYCTEGSELAPTKEALADYGEQAGAVTLEWILIPFGEDREAAQKQAAELFSRINGAEDQAAVFSALAAEHGDDSGPRTVLPGEAQSELMEAARALEEGQCSGILETEDGFSIVRRVPLDVSVLKESCFDEMLQTAAENSVVTTRAEYAKLDPAAFAAEILPKQNTQSE